MSTKGVEGSTTPPEGGPDRIRRDELFDLLSNHRRRYVLHDLQHRDDRVELGDLSERVAAWENGTDFHEVSADQRKRVYTSLQQVHLPRMAEAEVVEFDDRAGVVDLGPAAEDLDVYMEIVEGRDLPWSQYYLFLAVANAAVLAAGYVGIPPFTALHGAGVLTGAFAVTAFTISAAMHAFYGRTEMHLGTGDKPTEVEQ